MTVENWLRGHFPKIGGDISRDSLELAAVSPINARPISFGALNLADEIEANQSDGNFWNSADYALSTLYYLMSEVIAVGARSEKQGDRSLSFGAYALSDKEREIYRAKADSIRMSLGCMVEFTPDNGGGMFDASERINRV